MPEPKPAPERNVVIYIYLRDGTDKGEAIFLSNPKIYFTDKTILVTEQGGEPQWILLKKDVEAFVARRLD